MESTHTSNPTAGGSSVQVLSFPEAPEVYTSSQHFIPPALYANHEPQVYPPILYPSNVKAADMNISNTYVPFGITFDQAEVPEGISNYTDAYDYGPIQQQHYLSDPYWSPDNYHHQHEYYTVSHNYYTPPQTKGFSNNNFNAMTQNNLQNPTSLIDTCNTQSESFAQIRFSHNHSFPTNAGDYNQNTVNYQVSPRTQEQGIVQPMKRR